MLAQPCDEARMRRLAGRSRRLVHRLLLSLTFAGPLAAQTAPAFNFVMPTGPGRIPIDLAAGAEPQTAGLYDEGTRPTILIVNKTTGLDLSYILFPNDTGQPTSESCRDAVVNSILNNLGKAAFTDEVRSTRKLANGNSLALATYKLVKMGTVALNQQNVFGFVGDEHTCAEVHLSKVRYTPADEKLFHVELERFSAALAYVPTAHDYGAMATIYFEQMHDAKSAAVYYRSALDAVTDAPTNGYDALTMRRVLTDQLSMSYGMAGDLKRSREVNEAGIAKDPEYPIYYYNLADADAEAGDAVAARTHLQQAFDRRANTLRGEKMPDPTMDDSLLKLKKDEGFWKFVQSLPKA